MSSASAPVKPHTSLSLPLRISLISLVFAALVATVLTALGGYFLHDQQSENASAHARQAADELAQRASRLLAMGLALDDIIGFDEQCESVIRNDHLLSTAAMFGVDQRRRAASSGTPIVWPEGWIKPAAEVAAMVDTSDGRLAVHPILDKELEVKGYAMALVNQRAVLQATLSRVAWLVGSALVLFVAGLVIQQSVFWRTIGDPLSNLVRTADNIRPETPPDLALQWAPKGQADDDIGRLYGAFNRLLQRVAEARQQLLAQNEQLESTVRERTLQLELANAELAHDIERRQLLERDLRRLANSDVLTGLANRAFVLPHAEQRLQHARRQEASMGVAVFDFDGFKAINDTHGHAAGDLALKTMAARLAKACRSSDVLARIGGDEFLLVFEGFTHRDHVVAMARRMTAQFDPPVPFNGVQLKLGVSIGIALYPQDGNTLEELLAHADEAMYHVKQSGGGYLLCEKVAITPEDQNPRVVDAAAHSGNQAEAFGARAVQL